MITDLRVKGDMTKNRLLDAAEQLIAEKGFDAVSVRDITGLAQANVASVNYHFGCREGLLAAVLERRMNPLHTERAELLGGLGEEDGVREVLNAWARPLIGLFGTAGMSELSYCRVMGRCMEVLAAGVFIETSKASRLLDSTWQLAVEKCLPAMMKTDVSWRLHFAAGALIHLLVHGPALQEDFQLTKAIEQWIESTEQMFAGSDVLIERGNTSQKAPATRRKQKATAPLRQMAEVVSAAMEADEGAQKRRAKPARGNSEQEMAAVAADQAEKLPKPAEDDGYGELFLF